MDFSRKRDLAPFFAAHSQSTGEMEKYATRLEYRRECLFFVVVTQIVLLNYYTRTKFLILVFVILVLFIEPITYSA